jgi:hypothetical protein
MSIDNQEVNEEKASVRASNHSRTCKPPRSLGASSCRGRRSISDLQRATAWGGGKREGRAKARTPFLLSLGSKCFLLWP